MHQCANRNAFVTLFKVQDSSHVFAYHVRVIDDEKRKEKKKRIRRKTRMYVVLVRKRTVVDSPYARGRCNLIRMPIRSLSRLTKPLHLALSYLTSFTVCVECSSVLHSHEISCRVCKPNFTFPRCPIVVKFVLYAHI